MPPRDKLGGATPKELRSGKILMRSIFGVRGVSRALGFLGSTKIAQSGTYMPHSERCYASESVS